MIGIVISEKDIASVNIAKYLFSLERWKNNNGVFLTDDKLVYIINNLHIYHDNIDQELKELGYTVKTLIFASRHTSKIGKKTLSVHAIGNINKAEYGGKNKCIIPCNPLLMRDAIGLLKEKNIECFELCYEATHHGPYIETPSFFIEVGSTKKEWINSKACKAIAETLLEIEENNREVAIGIGGGHYAPRFTEIAFEKNVAFGHIAARYNIQYLTKERLSQMSRATFNCKKVYFHGNYPQIEKHVLDLKMEI